MIGMYKYLNYADRQTIQSMWAKGSDPKEIASHIGVHLATIYHELKRGETGRFDRNQRNEYDANVAQRRFYESLKARGKKKRVAL